MYSDFLVDKVVQESSSIRSFYLIRKDGQRLAAFLPGQFVTILVTPDGSGPVSRNYTLSDRPGLDYYRITVKKEADGLVSSFLHHHISEGDILKVSPPAGDFYLNHQDISPVVLISGGVGITPMLSMLEYIAAHQPGRTVYFLHSSTNRILQPMGERLKLFKKQYPDFIIKVYHSQPLKSEKQGVDYDAAGLMDLDFLKDTVITPGGGTYYLCGPYSFMQAMFEQLMVLGADASQVKYEFFGNARKLGSAITMNNTKKVNYRVHFMKSNLAAVWTGEHQSLLELSETAGVQAPYSCRMGSCSTCETGLMEGKVNYDPEPFLEVQEGRILLCCSQPISDLKLDL